jgi:hypothetical protein
MDALSLQLLQELPLEVGLHASGKKVWQFKLPLTTLQSAHPHCVTGFWLCCCLLFNSATAAQLDSICHMPHPLCC